MGSMQSNGQSKGQSNGRNRANVVRFGFTIDGLDPKALVVVRMQGSEAISRPYHFKLTLLSSAFGLEQERLLLQKCTLAISGAVQSCFHGVLTLFKWVRNVDRYSLYEAELAPRFQLLQQTRSSRVFLDKSIREIAEEVLQASGVLTAKDYDFRLQQAYPQREFVCQYNEPDFDFISRWFEQYGIFYFFEQTASGEVLVISDNPMAHAAMDGAETLKYVQYAGLEHLDRHVIVDGFSAKTRLIPQKTRVKDYNYRTPRVAVQGLAIADTQGAGEAYYYGENPKTPAEAEALAKVRAEGLACRKSVYSGRCYTPLVRTGFLMTLEDHYLGALNRQYLVVEARHRGSQENYLQSGLTVRFHDREKSEGYSNHFTAIPAATPFRPELRTPRPVASSSQSAFIDSPGGSMEAHLDDQGRYKVRLPFDLSGRKDGKASAWLRMAQPYVGKDFGMHFPLLKGTEVLLGFVHGDPDRPIISGAAPNPDYPSQVNDSSETKCRITSVAQNTLYMENQEGKQHIVMRSPTAQSWLRLGAPNDPPAADWMDSAKGPGSLGVKWCTAKGLVWKAGAFNSIVLGESGSFLVKNRGVYLGANSKTILGIKLALNVLYVLTLRIGSGYVYEANKAFMFGNKKELSDTDVQLCDTVNTADMHRDRITQITNELSTVNNDLVNLNNEVVRTKNLLSGELSTLQREESRLAMEKQWIAGQVDMLEQNATSAEAMVVSLNGEKKQVSDRVQELSASANQLSGEVQKLEEKQNTLAATIQNISASKATA